jgi:hypothetical protein
VFTGLDDPRLPTFTPPQDTVAPKAKARPVYDQMFGVYEKLYPALRCCMADLAGINDGG